MVDVDATNLDVLKEVLELLKCVDCGQLPARELWLLGGPCTHKYCEKCILAMPGKPCVKCTKRKSAAGCGTAHSPHKDLITTELLSNVKQYRNCVEHGNSCKCKGTAVDEYDFKGSPEADENNEGTKKSKLQEKSKDDKSKRSDSKIKTDKPNKTLVGGKESRPQSSEPEKQDDESKKPEHTNERKYGRHSVAGSNSNEIAKPTRFESVKIQPRLAKSTPKTRVGQPDESKSLSPNRTTFARRNSSSTIVNPVGSKKSDSTPRRGEAKYAATDTKMVKPSPTVYDLDEDEILKEEEEAIRTSTKLRERRTKVTLPLQKRRISLDEKSPDSPPDLTQHGNTPKKSDLGVDVNAPGPGTPKLASPTLPILSPATGRAFTTNEDRNVEKTPRRGVAKAKLESADLKRLKTSESHVLPTSPLIESPQGERRTITRGARSPSVASNASTLDSSVTSTSEKCNAKGETKLHVACRIGQLDKVKQLLNAPAVDINACDFAGWTPLHEAINSKSKQSFEIVQLLCEAGCDVNTPGLDNDTPLHECVRTGRIRTIKFLLSYGASTTLRNKAGKLPREVTENETIQKILDEFNGPYLREPDQGEIIQASMKNSVTFFAYKEDPVLLSAYKDELSAGVAKSFGPSITHVIFDQKLVTDGMVPFCLEYLSSVLAGVWLLSSAWVEDSVKAGKFLDPLKYEIVGCLKDVKSTTNKSFLMNVPSRARKNKESGNPGLFDGFNIYLFKTCGFEDLKKKDLSSLITAGGGNVVNREPNPESLDPLDYPSRFHVQDPDHKMTITSHVILYDDANKPTNLYNMEHMKTLRTDWFIESALHFTILNPDEFV